MVKRAQHTFPCLVVYPYPANRFANTPALRELQQRTYSLKGSGAPGTASQRTKEFVELLQSSAVASEFIPEDSVLVPIPTSAATILPPDPSRWAGLRIAEAMRSAGLGTLVVPALRRVKPVNSSHLAGPGARPSVWQHRESLTCDLAGIDSGDVVLVDDVLTSGSTAAACGIRLLESGYVGRIRVVAACYTEAPPYRLPAEPRRGHVTYTEGFTKAERELH